jgi:hypothetical protein
MPLKSVSRCGYLCQDSPQFLVTNFHRDPESPSCESESPGCKSESLDRGRASGGVYTAEEINVGSQATLPLPDTRLECAMFRVGESFR